MPEKQFKFEAQKNIDAKYIQVIMYEDDHDLGTLVFTPKGWEEFKEQVLRTKVRCE